jgi:hypothetical protein
MPDNSAEIAKLEKILNAGTEKTVVDGTVVERDLDKVATRLRQLRLTDDTQKTRRPIVSSIDLSGF